MPSTFERPTRFGRALSIAWWFFYIPFAVLEGRLLWEQTWLTWRRGPQMIGFSLAHQHLEIVLLGVLGGVLTALWVLVVTGLFLVKGQRLRRVGMLQLVVSVLTMVIAFLPIDRWVQAIRP
jgi:hypothetical protein